MHAIAESGAGVLVLEQQERPGFELLEELLACESYDKEIDTMGPEKPFRCPRRMHGFELPIEILYFLKIDSIRFIPNNPDEIDALLSAGIQIKELTRIQARPNEVHLRQTMTVN
jgi:GTP cyclohydrolase II